ncbi:MAG: signal peptidase I [bacterium]|nr:signal peptidase I [bacterium]
MKKFFASIWEVAEVVLIALVTVFIIRTFVIQPFQVSGASMSPNFQDHNYLLIDEVTYNFFRKPERGEVVVFRYPGDKTSFFIKRVIGLPGEQVVIHGGKVTITEAGENGKVFTLTESYLPAQTKTTGESTTKLAQDEYFVMGDNRNNSFDSRNWGPLHEEDITGIVRLRLYPFSEFETIRKPVYNF